MDNYKKNKSIKKIKRKNSNISIFQKIKNNISQNFPKSEERFKKIKINKKRDKIGKIGNYIIGETIGEGAFGKVKLARHIPTGEKVAIKILNKERIDINKIKKEIKILKKLKHINIIQLYEVLETKKHLYIVMEYCNGQELFTLIKSKHHLTEIEACKYFQQIINGVEYIHLSNITHRDLKPENLLLDDNNKRIVITDFGLSVLSEEYNNELNTPCGTLSYAPPEMLLGKKYNGIFSDIWSCGIILYVMLVGNLPCSEKDGNLIYQNIITHNYYYPENLSSDAIDLIEHLLKINPDERYSFDEIKAHPWFNLVPPKLKPGLQPSVQKIPIDEKILKKIKTMGYDMEKVEENVLKSKYNSLSAIYYLVLKQFKRDGIYSVSDLYSQDYINYLKDYKNWLDLSKINDPLYKDYEIELPINLENNDISNGFELSDIKILSNEILLEENKSINNNNDYISVNKSQKFDDIDEKIFENYINSDKMISDMEIKFNNNYIFDESKEEKINISKDIGTNKRILGKRNNKLNNFKESPMSINRTETEKIQQRKSDFSSGIYSNSINNIHIHVNKKQKEKNILLNEELSQNNKEKIILRLKNEESKFNEELDNINKIKNINNYDNDIIKIIAEKLIGTTIFSKYLLHNNKKSKTFLENKFYILQKYKNIIGLIERMRNKIFTKKLNDFNFYTFNEYLNDENDKMFVKNLIEIPYFNKFIKQAKETFYKKEALDKRTFSRYYDIKNNKLENGNTYSNKNLYTSYSNNFFEKNMIKKAKIIAFTPNRNINYSNLKTRYSNPINKNVIINYSNTSYKYKNIIKTPKSNRTPYYTKRKEKYNSNTIKKNYRNQSEGKLIKFCSYNSMKNISENKDKESSSSFSNENNKILNTENDNYYLNSEIYKSNRKSHLLNKNNSVNFTSKKVIRNKDNKIYNSPKPNFNKSIVISPYKNMGKRISVQLLSDKKEREKNIKLGFNNINTSLKELKEFTPINLSCIIINISPDKIIRKIKKFLMKKGYFCSINVGEYIIKATKGGSHIEIILYKLKYSNDFNSIYLSVKIKNKNITHERNFLNKIINYINENKD